MPEARILIVEDEQIVALDIKNTLESNGFLVAGQADRGEDAVKKAGELRPDLILMDIGLKGETDGIEAATRIRTQFDLPVIFLTAFGNPTTIERARLAEPYGYLYKPFQERELVTSIEMAIYKHSMERKLRENENKFRSVVEQATDGIALMDNLGIIVEWNPAMEQITGLQRPKTLGQPIWEITFQLVPPQERTTQTRDAHAALWKSSVTGAYSNADQDMERVIETPQGERRIVQSNGFAIQTSQGAMAGVIMRDVTRRKQAEEEVAKSEKRFRALIEHGRDNISLLSADGTLLWESPTAAHILDYAQDQFVGRNIFKLMHPDDLEWTQKLFTQVAQTPGSVREGIFRLARSDGSWRWIEATATNLLNEPSVQAIIINYRDITERRRVEMELEKLSQAVEQSANAIVITDVYGKIEYANPKFYEVSGYTQSEAQGQNPRILKSGRHDQEFYKNLWQTIKSGRVWRGEFQNRRKDGTLYWEDSTITPIYDTDHNLVNFLAVKEDITARKMLTEAERDQRQLAEALRDTSAALNSTLKLDEVLDRVLENIEKVTPFDAAMVLLVEGHSVRKIRHRNQFGQGLVSSLSGLGNTQANLINIPILHEMRETRKPCLIPDTQLDTRWRTIPGMGWIRSFISAPVEIRGHVVGIINVLSANPGFFTATHAERLVAFAGQAAIAIENAQLFEHAYYLSITDPLTELLNRRHFFEVARFEFDRIQRFKRTLSVMMVDIDHFKNINDTHGHTVGDLALREIALRIKSSVRSVDIVARYGGEEFIILMPETGLQEALQVAERVRKSVAETPLEEDAIKVSATLSIGVAEIDEKIKNVDQLIIYADRALYDAKANGRNRVAGYHSA